MHGQPHLAIPEPHLPPPEPSARHHPSLIQAWFGGPAGFSHVYKEGELLSQPRVEFQSTVKSLQRISDITLKNYRSYDVPSLELLSIYDCYNSLLRNNHWVRSLLLSSSENSEAGWIESTFSTAGGRIENQRQTQWNLCICPFILLILVVFPVLGTTLGGIIAVANGNYLCY